jgi:hypothetical protein
VWHDNAPACLPACLPACAAAAVMQVYFEEQGEAAEPLLAAVEGLDGQRLVTWLALPGGGEEGGGQVPPQVRWQASDHRACLSHTRLTAGH